MGAGDGRQAGEDSWDGMGQVSKGRRSSELGRETGVSWRKQVSWEGQM